MAAGYVAPVIDHAGIIGDWMAQDATNLNGVQVVTRLPADLQKQTPLVRIVPAGGPDDSVVIDLPTIVFHCFDTDEKTSRVLALNVRASLRSAVGVPFEHAIITRVRWLSLPAWVYYGPDVQRHVTTAQILMKPAPTA